MECSSRTQLTVGIDTHFSGNNFSKPGVHLGVYTFTGLEHWTGLLDRHVFGVYTCYG